MLRWIRNTLAQVISYPAERRRKILEAQEQKRQDAEARAQLLQSIAEKHKREQDSVLAILNAGKLPEIDWDRREFLPFKFMQSEHLIYVFTLVRYFEQRTKREIEGRSAGVSVRVMKGVSVRLGQSKGIPVEKEELIDREYGTLAITTKHLYFSGFSSVRLLPASTKSFRIKHSKIVSIVPYSDGVSITRDRVNAQPEFFVVGEEDNLFLCQLLQAVPSVEISQSGPEWESPEGYTLWTYASGGADGTLDDFEDGRGGDSSNSE